VRRPRRGDHLRQGHPAEPSRQNASWLGQVTWARAAFRRHRPRPPAPPRHRPAQGAADLEQDGGGRREVPPFLRPTSSWPPCALLMMCFSPAAVSAAGTIQGPRGCLLVVHESRTRVPMKARRLHLAVGTPADFHRTSRAGTPGGNQPPSVRRRTRPDPRSPTLAGGLDPVLVHLRRSGSHLYPAPGRTSGGDGSPGGWLHPDQVRHLILDRPPGSRWGVAHWLSSRDPGRVVLPPTTTPRPGSRSLGSLAIGRGSAIIREDCPRWLR